MKKMLIFFCLGMMMVAAGQAVAEDSKPIQLSLTPGIAIFDRTTRIQGFSLSIWGENPQDALAIGIVNGSTKTSAGFSLGVANYADSYKGVQWSLFNYAKENFSGWNLGIANVTKGSMKGLQTGVVNYAGHLKGLQIGAFNYAAKASGGVQIGVINIFPENKWFTGLPGELAPGMILVNWRF